MTDRVFWVWLSGRRGVGPVCAGRLLKTLGDPETIWRADAGTLNGLGFLRKNEREALLDKDLSQARRQTEVCRSRGWQIVGLGEPDYPQRLAAIYDPPTTLYIAGRLPRMDEEAAVAVVGTRNASDYGLRMADRVAYAFTRAGGLVLTGLALGVDTAAARGALRVPGPVVGVIGSGLDVVYPRENRALFAAVAEAGALVSEYPPGTEPSRGAFPARNRILSGLSLAVAVIEAPEKSGALITAARALEQGRDVFALPGNADAPGSRGTNRLLREGAIPLTSGWDLAEEYAALYPEKLGELPADREVPPPKPEPAAGTGAKKRIDIPSPGAYIDGEAAAAGLSGTERSVFLAVAEGCALTDEMIEKTGLSPQQVLSALTMLEISGLVTRDAGRRYEVK